MSILEEEQMLWIKSIFRVENNIIESIIPDYNDLLESLDKKDKINYFYISSDKAYILYLMQNYDYAIEIYNVLISYAAAHPENSQKNYNHYMRNVVMRNAKCKTNLVQMQILLNLK